MAFQTAQQQGHLENFENAITTFNPEIVKVLTTTDGIEKIINRQQIYPAGF